MVVGGDVSGAGCVEHGSVGFCGAGEVFELGGAQEGTVRVWMAQKASVRWR